MLHTERWNWITIMIVRVSSLALLTTAISLGATRVLLNVHAQRLFGRNVDIDVQLAILGLVNKVMDLLVTMSLENLAAVTLTLWMAGKKAMLGSPGVRLMDLGLSQELTKPWVSVQAFWKRCNALGWNATGYRGLLRFLVTLAISICVLLQGVAINTIGMPKERWNSEGRQPYPFLVFHGIDFTYWWAGFEIVHGGPASWDAGRAYSAASAFTSLRGLSEAFSRPDHGWQQVGGQASDRNLVALDTRLVHNTVQGIAIQNGNVQDIFQWFHSNGSRPARNAIGWHADVSLVVPSIEVSCLSVNRRVDGGTVNVLEPSAPSNVFNIDIGNSTEHASSTTACTITVSRSLFPTNVWIVDGAGPSTSVNHFGQNYSNIPSTLPILDVDHSITQHLSTQMNLVMISFESMVPNLRAAQLLRRNALRIMALRPDITSEDAALAAVIAMISTNVLAYGVWNVSRDSGADTMLTAYNIEWQLYGSSPRLNWEWVTVIVLTVLLLSIITGIIQSLVHPISPTKILKPDGMLVAANLSDGIQILRSHVLTEKTIQSAHFQIRDLGNGRVSIVEEPRMGSEVDYRKPYQWQQ
jgi:hypothetical protein